MATGSAEDGVVGTSGCLRMTRATRATRGWQQLSRRAQYGVDQKCGPARQ